MEIISGTKDFYISDATSVAIGKFDGVHLGHQKLVMEMKESLSIPGEKLKTCVFTFDPAPEVFFGKDYSLLTTRQEKRILFERKGIDILVEYPFDKETADLEPEAFLDEIIVRDPNATAIKDITVSTRHNDNRIYTIDGRYVGNDFGSLRRGIYIIDGKKVVK